MNFRENDYLSMSQVFGVGFKYADARKGGLRYKSYDTPRGMSISKMNKEFAGYQTQTRDGRVMEITKVKKGQYGSFLVYAQFV